MRIRVEDGNCHSIGLHLIKIPIIRSNFGAFTVIVNNFEKNIVRTYMLDNKEAKLKCSFSVISTIGITSWLSYFQTKFNSMQNRRILT